MAYKTGSHFLPATCYGTPPETNRVLTVEVELGGIEDPQL